MTDRKKYELFNLIGAGKIEHAIARLLALDLSKEVQGEVYALSARYQNLEKSRRLGLLNSQDIQIIENQITNSLISLLKQLPEEASLPEKYSQSKQLMIGFTALSFMISIAMVIWLMYSGAGNADSTQLTVQVMDELGRVVLEQEGELNIAIGNRSLNKMIGENGRTNFADIVSKYLGDTLSIGLDAPGWEIAKKQNKFVFNGTRIDLIVRRDGSLGFIRGVVKSQDGQHFIPKAEVMVNTDTIIYTDDKGMFKARLLKHHHVKNEHESYTLTVSKAGYQTTSSYYLPKSSSAEIRLSPIAEK